MKTASLNINIMKKLANVSPFLLLLVPVFMMMVLTIANSVTTTQNEEMAAKATTSVKGIAKVSTISFK
ncbi:hypothetical protein [Pedobacter steynii]|uniref:Uncharacterized protein n=1 Tax=Pedobacter steynii TaxID=430522 RepID=A0A1D7QG36_9SPHI|nr:hypothetical protein [Pedobacter steynii]AOM77652.1 hypothetical protein BFS30_11025 [Pedobacter steynii]